MAVHPTLPLAELRAYAEAHPAEWFDLNSCTACLACRVSGQTMIGHHNFAPGGAYGNVDHAFAFMTAELRPTNRPDLTSDNTTPKFFTGAELAAAITRLEDDDHHFDVADSLNRLATEAVPV